MTPSSPSLPSLWPSKYLSHVWSLMLSSGMDDLRDLQPKEEVGSGFRVLGGPIDIILHKETMEALKKQYK